jgi:LysM repeat protein
MKKTIAIFAAGLLALSLCACNETKASEYSETTVVYVDSGDSLWGIAREHGDSRYDARDVIDEIQKLNNLPDSTIYPGQKLKIPVYD